MVDFDSVKIRSGRRLRKFCRIFHFEISLNQDLNMIILNVSSNTKLIYVKFYIEIASDFVKE
jgi:hypothetical protein